MDTEGRGGKCAVDVDNISYLKRELASSVSRSLVLEEMIDKLLYRLERRARQES